MSMKFFFSFLLLLVTNLAYASDENNDDKVVYKKTTEIDFDSLDIEAELVKPQGSLVVERRRAAFNPLIQIRLNWNEEIAQSTDDVK